MEVAIAFANKMRLPTLLSTDNINFKCQDYSLEFNLLIRDEHLSNDTASTESVFRDAYERGYVNESDTILLLQPTSPLRTLESCNKIIMTYENLKNKSGICIFSVTEDYSQFWVRDDKERWQALTNLQVDHKLQRRSQDRRPIYKENGSYYVFQAKDLLDVEYISDLEIIPFITPTKEDSDINTESEFINTELIYRNLLS